VARRIIDVNCDLGEGFGQWSLGDVDDDALMRLISSANIATGFHAGDPNLMDRTVRHARQHGVGVGAHPGFRDLQGFGRRFMTASGEELVNDVIYQIGALREFTRRHDVRLQHVKLHGALYMHAAKDEDFSRILVDALQRIGPELYIYCMGISATCEVARRAGQPAVRELYADRAYERSGSIVFTRHAGVLDPQRIAEKVVRACLDGKVETIDGSVIDIEFESICFHSDTPGALAIGQAVRTALNDNGIRIAPIAEVILQ
jgi:5-oxoprolinase (ATP-hydrolysing) subunit A